MLTLMRQLLRTKAAGLLFVLLIVAMAAWGVTDVFGGGLGSNLAGAGDRKLSEREFDSTVERILRNQTDDRGRSISKEQALESGLIDQVFQREQLNLLLQAYADQVGIRATQQAVQNDIIATPDFQDTTGVFDPVQYRGVLDVNGFTTAGYQNNIAREMTIQRLQRVPVAALQIPDALGRIEAAYGSEQRNVSWFTIRQDDLPDIGEPSEEDIEALYTEAQANLREPERRRISLLRVSPRDFVSQAEVTEEDITAFYEAYKPERYTAPGARVFTEFHFTDETMARAALGRIAGGASASALEGLDSTLRKTGGADQIAVPRLATQVFGNNALPGGIFGPLQNGDLWTIIRLEEIIPGDVTSLDEVRDDIHNELGEQQALGLFYEALPRLDDLIGTGASLEDIGTDIGVPVLSFDAVDQSGRSESGQRYATLLEAPGLIAAAFNRAEGTKTERFGDDEITWLGRVDAIVPERQPEIDEVRDLIIASWKQRETDQQLQSAAQAIEASLSSGEKTMAELAAENNAVLQSLPGARTRGTFQANLPNFLIAQVFEARRTGQVLTSPGLAGEMIIAQVTEINRADAEALDAMARDNANRLQNELASDLSQAFFFEIQRDIEVEVNGSGYQAYKSRITPDL